MLSFRFVLFLLLDFIEYGIADGVCLPVFVAIGQDWSLAFCLYMYWANKLKPHNHSPQVKITYIITAPIYIYIYTYGYRCISICS